MTLSPTEFLQTLESIVGSDHVLTAGDLSMYEQDWRGRSRGRALAVVRPGSTAEVAAVVRQCAENQVAIVAQGGNTGLNVGATPDDSGKQLVLHLGRMNKVMDIDGANLTMTVQAGCILQSLQHAADEAGFLFPLSLGAEGSCMIGGNLATNAGGTQVVRYGNARELCLGLEVVTAQGDVWPGLTGLRKDNTGYDLRGLFIGSEGTLGIITGATLKLYPKPAAQLTAWAALPSMQAAVELLGLAHQRLGPGLTGFEVMGHDALALTDQHFPQLRTPLWQDHPWCVLLENSDHESEQHARVQFESLLETAFEAGCVSDAIVAENLAQAHDLWHVRESITLAQAEEGPNIKHDISVPIARIPLFVSQTDARLKERFPGIRIINFGHLGDGNLHYNMQTPTGVDGQAFLRDHEPALSQLVFDAVAEHGGSISAEHGIGSLKTPLLPRYKSPVALQLMAAIKSALDPQNIMNPGRIIA